MPAARVPAGGLGGTTPRDPGQLANTRRAALTPPAGRSDLHAFSGPVPPLPPVCCSRQFT